LGDELFNLWQKLPIHDQAHSIVVWRRYLELRPNASRAVQSAVLLHDIGKIKSGLGIHARVFATILGPRTKRWRMYSEHEVIGAAMLETLNADPLTVEIVRGEGQPEVQAALRQADTI
jgi:response regulator RpfG family c-di-GMP phosphodiesterase